MISSFKRYNIWTRRFAAAIPSLVSGRLLAREAFKHQLIHKVTLDCSIDVAGEEIGREVLERDIHVGNTVSYLCAILEGTDWTKPLEVEQVKNYSFLCAYIDKRLKIMERTGDQRIREKVTVKMCSLVLGVSSRVVKSNREFLTSAIASAQKRCYGLVVDSLEEMEVTDLLRVLVAEMNTKKRGEEMKKMLGMMYKKDSDMFDVEVCLEVLDEVKEAPVRKEIRDVVRHVQYKLIDCILFHMQMMDDHEAIIRCLKSISKCYINIKDSRIDRLVRIIGLKLKVNGDDIGEGVLKIAEGIRKATRDPTCHELSQYLRELSRIESTHTHRFMPYDKMDDVYAHLIDRIKLSLPEISSEWIDSRQEIDSETSDIILHNIYQSLYTIKHYDREIMLEGISTIASDRLVSIKTCTSILRYLSLCVNTIRMDNTLMGVINTSMMDRYTQYTGKEERLVKLEDLCINMWGMCVMFDQIDICEHVRLLFDYLVSHHEGADMDVSLLNMLCAVVEYMKGFYEPPNAVGVKLLSNYHYHHATSVKDVTMLNIEVVDVLKRLNVPFNMEKRVGILDVDVVIKGAVPGDIEICIDVHGYQHFFRNREVLLGNNYLKSKMLKRYGYGYFEISLIVWSALDDKGKMNYVEEGIKTLRKS